MAIMQGRGTQNVTILNYHFTALRAWWNVYTGKTKSFETSENPISRSSAMVHRLGLLLHILPYVIVLSLGFCYLLYWSLGFGVFASQVSVGITLGIMSATLVSGFLNKGTSIVFSFVFGLLIGCIFALHELLLMGGVFGVVFAVLLSKIHYCLIAPLFAWGWLPYRLHPVVWDRTIQYKYPWFDITLLDFAADHPSLADAEYGRLLSVSKRQRSSIFKAQICLLAFEAIYCRDLRELLTISRRLSYDINVYNVSSSDLAAYLAMIAHLAEKMYNCDATPKVNEAKLLLASIDQFTAQAKGWCSPVTFYWVEAARRWRRLVLIELQGSEQTVLSMNDFSCACITAS